LPLALNFNAIVAEASSKPKPYNFLLKSSFMNFYLDFHFMCLCYCSFMIPNVVCCEQ
jgi:hypothetical protein